MNENYRTDIDGLRAVAVISVILFHLSYLPNGYLGVDIFFVISGYLITGKIFSDVEKNKFSILRFYEKRIRRIIPLVLFTTLIAFVLGLLFMLPDDLENLSQSVFASNISANNILMKIKFADYWSVQNDYKPLMHTWSLGIEEQFYLLYPIIFYFLQGGRKKYLLPLLIFLSAISLLLFFISNNALAKFYFLQYRFFELSIGGVCAIYFSKRDTLVRFKKSQFVLLLIFSMLVFLLFFKLIISNDLKILFTVILTASILVLGDLHFQNNSLYEALLSNKVFRGIGKISFSIYMWHHIVFAFSRYVLIEEISFYHAIILILLVVILSIASYFFIENPFRKKNFIKTKALLLVVSIAFLFLTTASLYVYMKGGIIKDVPELGISTSNNIAQLIESQSNINIKYNEDIRILNEPFTKTHKVKVLVIGNSFGRDVANIILESSVKDWLELRYSDLILKSDDELITRCRNADLIFFGSDYPTENMKSKYSIDMNKVWVFGLKNFGYCNGIHYNSKIKNYSTYRTSMKTGILERNDDFKNQWAERYIDLIELVADAEGRVLVFTPQGKFISQDTGHFTKFGAAYFAELLDSKLKEIIHLK